MIYAEAKLGELLRGNGTHKQAITDGSSGKTIGSVSTLPPGIDKRTSHQAQTIAANPEKVQAAIEAARKAALQDGQDGGQAVLYFQEWQKSGKKCPIKAKGVNRRSANPLILFGWETWIRTTIHGVRVLFYDLHLISFNIKIFLTFKILTAILLSNNVT